MSLIDRWVVPDLYLFFQQNSRPMKGKSKQTAIFIEVGKNLAREKSHSRKQTYSFFQNSHFTSQNVTPSTAPHISSTQNSASGKRKISLTHHPKLIRPVGQSQGMNDQFMYTRKENHLNTHFNLRKTKLREITKENKQIYKRINSQKSLYSSIELNKSFELNNGIKKRLSQSKLSQRSSNSRISQRSKVSTSKGDRPVQKKKDNISIKTSSINHVPDKDLNNFKGLFSSTNQQVRSSQNQKQARNFSNNSYRNNEIYARASLKPISKTPVGVSQDNKLGIGGLLHRIEEEMKPINDKKSSKKIHGYMKPKVFPF